MNIKLSVIVPCYNEESRFGESFSHYISYLKKQKYLWELILVNDGSKDKTLEFMEKSAKENKNVKIVDYSQNHGKGYAIVQGVRAAKGDYILFSDLDHSVSIDTIESFFDYFNEGFKVIIGSRRLKGAKLIKRQHAVREFLGRGFTFLVRTLIDWQIKDATCGFKAFEKNIAKKLFKKITIYDWVFDAELLFLCKKHHIKFAQAPVAWQDVRGSKVSLQKDIFNSLIGLLKIRLNDLKKMYD